jgi:hypothetical protein
MGTLLTRIPLSRDCISSGSEPGDSESKIAGKSEVAIRFYNALVLSTLRQGKQLQLWDSNVHRITIQGSRHLHVPTDYHN